LSWHKTSTSALPMPMTSISERSRTAAPLREVPADEKVEALAGGRRKRFRARDHGVREQARALARAGRPERRDQPPQHVFRRRRRTSFAVRRFFIRFWTTASTLTAAWVSCQTS